MRKNSVVDFVLAKKIIAAVMIFCQAVFLLPKGAQASITAALSDISLSNVSVGIQAAGRIPLGVIATAHVPKVRFEIFDSSDAKVGEYIATSTAISYYVAMNITSLVPGTYTVRAMALGEDSSVWYTTPFKQVIVGTVTTLNFLSPEAGASIAGTASVSVKCSDPSATVKLYYRPSAGGTYGPLAVFTPNAAGIYEHSWDSTAIANGGYVIMAKATKDGSLVASKEVTFSIFNQVAMPSDSTAAATTTQTTDPDPQAVTELAVWMLEAPSSTASQRSLSARVNMIADSVKFIVDGQGEHRAYPGTYSAVSAFNNYTFIWDAQNYAPGSYTIRAEATKDAQTKISAPISIIKLPSTTAQFETSSSTTYQQASTTVSSVVTKIDIGSSAIGGVASGTVSLFAKTSANIAKVHFLLEKTGSQELIGQAAYDTVRGYWLYKWNAGVLPDGPYNVLAIGYDAQSSKFYSNTTLKVYISNRPTYVASTTAVKIAEASSTVPAVEKEIVEAAKVATTTAAVPVVQPIKVVEPAKPAAVAATTIIEATKTPVAPVPAIEERAAATAIPSRPSNTSTSQVSVVDKPATKTPQQAANIECQFAGIIDAQQCELYRFSHYAIRACLEAGLQTKGECISLVRSKFGEPEICQKISPARCDALFSEVIIDRFIPQKKLDGASQALKGLVGKNIQFINKQDAAEVDSGQEIYLKEKNGASPLEKSLEGAILSVSPFAKNQDKIGVTVLAVTEGNSQDEAGVRAVLSIDADSDGLSDDIEKRLGTDPSNGDSDEDGFSDGDEVRTGHNPLGAGMLAGKLHPAEQALLNRVAFEQPKSAGAATPDVLAVKKVEIKPAASSTSMVKLTGRALPDQVLSIFIYSALPIIVTVMADQNGDWSYELDKTLTNGKHEAYVVLNDEQGRIESKSAPFSFLVNEARAISQDDLLKADVNVYNQTDTMLWWYALAGVILILFIAGLFFLYIKSKKTTSLG